MKILDKILSVLGFESGQEDTSVNVKEKSKKTVKKASFNLKKSKKIEEIKITNEQEVTSALNQLKKSKTLIFNISGFEKTKRLRAFDFISGAVFALEGMIKKIEDNKYICTIDDTNYFEEENE